MTGGGKAAGGGMGQQGTNACGAMSCIWDGSLLVEAAAHGFGRCVGYRCDTLLLVRGFRGPCFARQGGGVSCNAARAGGVSETG